MGCSSETSQGEQGVPWPNLLGDLGLTVRWVPLLQDLSQRAQLPCMVPPPMGRASPLLGHRLLSLGCIQEVGSQRTLGKADSNSSSPLPSTCLVLGTVLSGHSITAHIIARPPLPPHPPPMRWVAFYCVHFTERKPEVWVFP